MVNGGWWWFVGVYGGFWEFLVMVVCGGSW